MSEHPDPLVESSLPCFRCGGHRREHPVPGVQVCRRWWNPRGRTNEPAVARDRRLDPPPPWLAADVAADARDAEILDRHRAALVTVADVLAAHRPWGGADPARKVIFALHRRGLLAEPPTEPPASAG